VIDRHATDTADPGLHVAKTDAQVLLDAVLGDLAGYVHVKQVVGGDLDILATHEELVGSRHVLIEDLRGDRGEGRVSNPSAVVAGAHLTQLVSAHAFEGFLVGYGVILDRDLSSHATHGVDAALVAGLDEELDLFFGCQ